MFVRRMELSGFKSFSGVHELRFSRGLNLLVGDNNSGKSSVLEALNYLRDGVSAANPLPLFVNHTTNQHVTVTVDVAGCADRVEDDARLAKFKDYLFDADLDGQILRLQRSSEPRDVTQNGKTKTLSVSSITVWNEEAQQFENPTGIDAPVKALIDFEPVWADLAPDDAANFATNKTLGRLARLALGELDQSDEWDAFKEAHRVAFVDGEKSVVSLTTSIAVDLSKLVSQQYGETRVRFDFPAPEADALVKGGVLMVEEDENLVALSQKGTGLRRAISLALIQLYAKSRAKARDDAAGTPVILLIDEPETWLHPKAQLKLIEALATLVESEQVFVATHSPYLLRAYEYDRDTLLALSTADSSPRVRHDESMGLLTDSAPSWGEINYHAFELVSDEYHNELFSYLQVLYSPDSDSPLSLRALEQRLIDEGLELESSWCMPGGQPYPCTLPHMVRNAHHHPENPLATSCSLADLERSTALLQQLALAGQNRS